MPSKFIAKAFVREEIVRAVNKSRREVDEEIESLGRRLEELSKSSLEEVREEVAGVRGALGGLCRELDRAIRILNKDTGKLSMVLAQFLKAPPQILDLFIDLPS